MICKRIQPCPEVREYVREYLTIHLVFDNLDAPPPPKAYPVNPEEGIRFVLRGTLYAEDPNLGTIEKMPRITLFGQPGSRQNLYVTHEYLMIHVRFQPGAWFKLLRIPMVELVHQRYDASLILGNEIDEVEEQLSECDTYDAMFAVLNNYFKDKFSNVQGNNRPIDNIGKLILDDPQSFSLQKTAQQACLSYSQFEKRFVQQVGLTPKYYARICRFYQAYVLKECQPGLDWLSVAIRTGYTDYQHLVKDFKQFSGTTPNTLIKESLNNPERRFTITSDFRGV